MMTLLESRLRNDRILEYKLLDQKPIETGKTGFSIVIAIANELCSAVALQPTVSLNGCVD